LLCIRVYDRAKVPTATLGWAIKEADRVFQQARIEMQWAEGTGEGTNGTRAKECEQPAGPLMLSIKILFGPDKARPVAAEEAFFVIAEPYGRGGVEAALFYQHIDSFAKAETASQSLVPSPMRLDISSSGRSRTLPEGS
jgi:hypothetical protein